MDRNLDPWPYQFEKRMSLVGTTEAELLPTEPNVDGHRGVFVYLNIESEDTIDATTGFTVRLWRMPPPFPATNAQGAAVNSVGTVLLTSAAVTAETGTNAPLEFRVYPGEAAVANVAASTHIGHGLRLTVVPTANVDVNFSGSILWLP